MAPASPQPPWGQQAPRKLSVAEAPHPPEDTRRARGRLSAPHLPAATQHGQGSAAAVVPRVPCPDTAAQRTAPAADEDASSSGVS